MMAYSFGWKAVQRSEIPSMFGILAAIVGSWIVLLFTVVLSITSLLYFAEVRIL